MTDHVSRRAASRPIVISAFPLSGDAMRPLPCTSAECLYRLALPNVERDQPLRPAPPNTALAVDQRPPSRLPRGMLSVVPRLPLRRGTRNWHGNARGLRTRWEWEECGGG